MIYDGMEELFSFNVKILKRSILGEGERKVKNQMNNILSWADVATIIIKRKLIKSTKREFSCSNKVLLNFYIFMIKFMELMELEAYNSR